MRLVCGAMIWKLKGTYGFPLDMAIEILAQNETYPTWVELFHAAADDGTNIERLLEEVSFYVRESYPREAVEYIVDRLPMAAELGVRRSIKAPYVEPK